MTDFEKQALMKLIEDNSKHTQDLAKEVKNIRIDFHKYHEAKVQPLHDLKHKFYGMILLSGLSGGTIATVVTKLIP